MTLSAPRNRRGTRDRRRADRFPNRWLWHSPTVPGSLILTLLRTVPRVIRTRGQAGEPLYPHESDAYDLPALDGGPGPMVDEIPIGHNLAAPARVFPAPILAGCREPLPSGVPDLRGVWKVHKGMMRGNVERIEQAGDRVVITSMHIVHDMRADGVLEHGVHDVSPVGEEIRVMAEFRNGRLDLRPNGGRVMVTRYLDGDEMVWRYGLFRNRLRRLPGPPIVAE